MGGDLETEVAQNLRTEPVSQSDIFEPNQSQLRPIWRPTGYLKPNLGGSLTALWLRARQNGCAAVMVSDSLTVGL